MKSALPIIAGVVIGIAILGFIFFGISKMGRQAEESGIRGVIVEKEFRPEPETQITLGREGVRSQRVEGEYIFKVKAGDKTYDVWVDRLVYAARKVGDEYRIPRAALAPSQTPPPPE